MGHLNIAMLGHKRVPSREGGIEVVVGELSTRMVSLGHQVTCYNRSGHHVSGKKYSSKEINNYKGVHIRKVPTISLRGIAAMSSSFFAAGFSAFGKYDVVHIHAEGPAFMCWLPKLMRKRVIVTIHGLDHKRAKWGRMGRTYILMGEKNAVRFADEIIVLSEDVQKYFMKTYGRRTILIPNGVNRPTQKAAEKIQSQFGLQKDSYILYLGRIVPEKGIQYLIKAFKQLDTDKKLVIAGGSSDSDIFSKNLKEMAASDERILFTGFVQGQMLEELYSNCYLYCLPSDLEGMPLSLLEALSYGNCCVVSDIPECKDVVENQAAVFPKGNVKKLKECLQELCDDSATVAQYKKQAADFICEKYKWDDVVEKTLKLYSENILKH